MLKRGALMRSCGVAVLALATAVSCAAQEIPEQTFKAFARGFLSYAPASVFTLTENTTGATPVGPYQAVRVERTSIKPDAKDQVGMLADPKTRMAAAGLLFPLPANDPPVTPETLPLFVQQRLTEAMSTWLSSRVRIPWPMTPTRPGAVVALTADVATGYGTMHMKMAVTADGKYLVIGDTWPLDRDPRAVRREILESSVIQWDPGHEAAPVKVVEFSDFQCPACKRGWGEVKPVLAHLGDKVRHGLVNFPLFNAHPWAFRAAVAGECVGSLWPDKIVALKEEFYRLQDTLTVESVDPAVFAFLADHNLSSEKFRACYLKDPAIDTVLRQLDLGYRLGVTGTPTYFANGESLPWGEPEWFSKRIAAIAAAAGGRPESAAEITVAAPTPAPAAKGTGKPAATPQHPK
ncbi:MAG: thioredoxin domain-containing protein [Thermoanaerobaculaceae bacterium]|nr:thioredoxin domain-containing protein [Thermoanaerobaculaceae bacterium]